MELTHFFFKFVGKENGFIDKSKIERGDVADVTEGLSN